MKKSLFVLVIVLNTLFGCSDQHFVDDTLVSKAPPVADNDFYNLIEQARWGDGQAFLKLADCYRDGKGVDKDFVGMLSMVAQADEFGSIRQMGDYLKELPEGSDFRMIFDAIEKFEDKQVEEAKSITEQLLVGGSSDGYTVQGIMAIECKDTLEGLRLIEQAASEGSTFANLILCIPELQGGKKPDVEKLKSMSEKKPYVNMILAKMYIGEDDEGMRDDRLAAHYYLKADENACLSKQGARWLLGYHNRVSKLPLSERDIQRLQILAEETSVKRAPQQDCEYDEYDNVVEVVDSVVVDTVMYN